MRRRRQFLCLLGLLSLLLGQIESDDHLCGEECSFATDVAVSETAINFFGNHTIINVTFSNGTESYYPQGNDSLSGLVPGTQYFVYFSGSNSTTCCKFITKPSPVSDIRVESIGTTTANLTWKNHDLNASNYSYIIEMKGRLSVRNVSFDTTSAFINNLEPGTLYIFRIYPVAPPNETAGQPKETSLYTRPNPVFDIRAESVSTTAVNLTWKNPDQNATYTYIIQIEGHEPARNKSSDTTSAFIDNLVPGTLYIFTIFPVAPDNGTMGEPNKTSLYTKPLPVSDIIIEDISSSALTLKWNSTSNYTYVIEIEEDGHRRNISSDTNSALITNLNPGSPYTFKIYPVAADNETVGDSTAITVYTKPNPVVDIQPEDISTTSVSLFWKSNDPDASTYTYLIEVKGNHSVEKFTSNATNILIRDLEPGTSYTFIIFPQVAGGEAVGEPNNTTLYTIPSKVIDIKVADISSTMVNITWKSPDFASPEYFYRIIVSGGADENKTFPSTSAIISGLSPGTYYKFSIYSVAQDNTTEGNSSSIDHCTIPARVNDLKCNPVDKQAKLLLNWTSPHGKFEGFLVSVLNNSWNTTVFKDFETTITDLDYYTNYTVSVATLSCERVSIPVYETCCTSITDPPPPSDPPAVKATNHYSLNVQFGIFNSSHGPVTAYAVVVTTSEGAVSNDSLLYTHADFMRKKTNSYVASVIEVQRKRSSSSDNQRYNMEVGDGSQTYGYVNGKLDPLGLYRACVAGFTQIDFNKTIDLIDVEKSFVSFSPVSESVLLPQNPDVIIGAVVGCVLAAAVVFAALGFMVWKKRRSGGKNSDVPFSLIESKSMKVENFESYFKKQKADSNCGFAEEYENLRPVGIHQPKFAAELPENKGKNRYNNVLPYEFSRVKLLVQTNPTDDYINANYMPGYNSKNEFIAAQGPLPTAVQDFWRMIWEKDIYAVVMLTKCVEQGRTKCEEYWPNKQSKSYGDITVAMTSEIVLPEWTIRDFSLEKADSSKTHPVRQFHFTAWPDHGVPETTDLLINFRHLVQEYMKLHPHSPTLVHCSAGVGRTGTFIALDRLIHQMEMENTIDVYGVVYDLRMHRSLMVQTEDQYVFLNQCVLDIIRLKKERRTDLIYQNTDAMAMYENFTPSPHTGKSNGYHA